MIRIRLLARRSIENVEGAAASIRHLERRPHERHRKPHAVLGRVDRFTVAGTRERRQSAGVRHCQHGPDTSPLARTESRSPNPSASRPAGCRLSDSLNAANIACRLSRRPDGREPCPPPSRDGPRLAARERPIEDVRRLSMKPRSDRISEPKPGACRMTAGTATRVATSRIRVPGSRGLQPRRHSSRETARGPRPRIAGASPWRRERTQHVLHFRAVKRANATGRLDRGNSAEPVEEDRHAAPTPRERRLGTDRETTSH